MQSTQNQVTEDVVTPAATLQCAALYLDRFGWIQGDYYDQSRSVFTPAACMVGAIGMVCYGYAMGNPHLDVHEEYDEFSDALSALRQHVESLGFDEGVFVFNDACGFTSAKAVRVLNDAAAFWTASRDGAA